MLMTLQGGKHKSELNFDNPLGFRGALASAYGALLGQIHRQPPPPFVDPRKFRNVIKRTHPFMDSYEQQDSQEYLMALMDGVAEDLNRIVKKPAVEKPDSTDEMVTNREALEKFAATSWELYKVRNDSVMTDLFAGMYKSTLHCPNCEKVSISFDPFINLTLPIPNRQVIYREVIVQKIGQAPVKVIVEVDASQSLLAFKKEVAKRSGISHNRLIGGEVYNGTFYQYLNEASRTFREVNLKAEDDVLFMEVDGAVQDRILIPVFNRYRSGTNNNTGKPSFRPFALPFMISLIQEETRDAEAIYNKVLKQVAALTTRDILNEKEPETEKAARDASDENDDEAASHPLAGKISQSLLRLFDMKVLEGQAYGRSLPLGRNLDNSRDYFLLTSRIPAPTPEKEAENNSEGSTDGNSDASGEAEAPQSPASEVADDWFLIQSSDALLLDWNDDAKDALFGGKDYDEEDVRGKATYQKPELLSDPEILKRKSEWDTRRTKGVSLDECLDEFGKEEILEEQESWFCPRCKTHTRAKKKFDLWSTPDVLVIHLKRFCIINRFRRMKLDTLVDFPLEELDLSRYITGPDDGKAMKYDLIGVDNHSGSMNGGHYTAYCKNFEDGRWYDFNGMYTPVPAFGFRPTY
jgi:ubiquitin carboxyl-terminal hydrolase 4/11/15